MMPVISAMVIITYTLHYVGFCGFHNVKSIYFVFSYLFTNGAFKSKKRLSKIRIKANRENVLYKVYIIIRMFYEYAMFLISKVIVLEIERLPKRHSFRGHGSNTS